MFLWILLLPLVFTALMPRRWLSLWFATLLLGFGLCWLDFGRVNGGAADMFGMAFLVMLLLAVMAVGAGRVLLARVFRKVPAPEANTDVPPHGVNLYFAGLSGVVIAAVLLFATLKLADAVWPSALALHFSVAAAGGVVWLLIPRVWPWPPTDHRVQVQTVFRWAVALCCAGALAWSLVSAHTKILAAQLSAQGQPYCLHRPPRVGCSRC
jgi:hypothetical protein